MPWKLSGKEKHPGNNFMLLLDKLPKLRCLKKVVLNPLCSANVDYITLEDLTIMSKLHVNQ